MARLGSLARAALVACLLLSPAAQAAPVSTGKQYLPPKAKPKILAKVQVNEHLGAQVPLSLTFRDENGKPVKLGDYFDGKQPVILTFNYSKCPMLCGLMLHGLVKGLKQIEWVPGKTFRILTISIDHNETPDTALTTQRRYLADYGRPEAKAGWHFLTGTEESVAAYGKALGFGFAYDPNRKEYAHPSVMAVASPTGKIVRYLYGIQYPPKSLKLALLEASQGKIGDPFDRLVLYCFHYDATVGRYAPVAANIMRVGGAVAVVLFGGFLTLLLRAERKRQRQRASSAKPAESVS